MCRPASPSRSARRSCRARPHAARTAYPPLPPPRMTRSTSVSATGVLLSCSHRDRRRSPPGLCLNPSWHSRSPRREPVSRRRRCPPASQGWRADGTRGRTLGRVSPRPPVVVRRAGHVDVYPLDALGNELAQEHARRRSIPALRSRRRWRCRRPWSPALAAGSRAAASATCRSPTRSPAATTRARSAVGAHHPGGTLPSATRWPPVSVRGLDQEVGGVLARPHDRVGQDQPALGVGVEHLDASCRRTWSARRPAGTPSRTSMFSAIGR